MECTCKRCGKTWNARVDKPKQCPYCKRYDWNEDKTKKEENKKNDMKGF